MTPLQRFKEVLFVKHELRILLILANLTERSGLYGLIFAYARSSIELRFKPGACASHHYISALL